MGPAGFDNAPVFLLQPLEGGSEDIDGREHLAFQAQHRGNVHGRGEGVVGGLGHIHVVIGVQQLLPRDGVAPPGNDLVGIHVGLGAGAGLPDHQREVVGKLSGDHLIRRGGDGGQLLLSHLFGTKLGVCLGGGLFQNTEGVDDLLWHSLLTHANGKILVGPLGLGPPVFVRGDLHIPHGVVFDAIVHVVPPVFSFTIHVPHFPVNGGFPFTFRPGWGRIGKTLLPHGGPIMFDNPRKELEKLQQELLAAEAEQDETADLEPEEDYGTPVDWDEGDREPLSKSYTDSDDDTLIWQTEELEPEEPEEEDFSQKPEKKHYVGLKFAIALELLGIAALFWWWYLWIR